MPTVGKSTLSRSASAIVPVVTRESMVRRCTRPSGTVSTGMAAQVHDEPRQGQAREQHRADIERIDTGVEGVGVREHVRRERHHDDAREPDEVDEDDRVVVVDRGLEDAVMREPEPGDHREREPERDHRSEVRGEQVAERLVLDLDRDVDEREQQQRDRDRDGRVGEVDQPVEASLGSEARHAHSIGVSAHARRTRSKPVTRVLGDPLGGHVPVGLEPPRDTRIGPRFHDRGIGFCVGAARRALLRDVERVGRRDPSRSRSSRIHAIASAAISGVYVRCCSSGSMPEAFGGA